MEQGTTSNNTPIGAGVPWRDELCLLLWAILLVAALRALGEASPGGAAVQTFGLYVECPRPADDAPVLIVAQRRDDRWVGECLHPRLHIERAAKALR